ncbi:MAG TPA: tetratricopeptide repeat protein [Hyphomicrobiaceae bacterium]|nr:tetratricopeptide repeat protein [Hyphomicrobiaceae bacterium]
MANEPKDALAREIDEELRREQLLKLWDKYGVLILGAALAVILAVAGWQYYRSRQLQANEAASAQFIVGLSDLAANRTFDGQKRLEELVAKGPHGYATLARLRLAAQSGTAGDTIDALNIYEAIVKDEKVDSILQDFARLQIVMLKFDSVPFSELRNQLSLLGNDRNPWRYSARELLGMGAMKAGLPIEARNHFQRLLGDRATPPGVAERARMMMAMLEETAKNEPQPAPGHAPGAEQKPETPAKSGAAEDKAKVAPGKTK